MGIRYYAYPVPPAEIPRARADPQSLLTMDHFLDAWLETNANQCYLDKAWAPLQRFFDGRPTMTMLRGDVTQLGWGYRPWVGVVDPAEVQAIVSDLASVAEEDIRAFAAEDQSDWFGFDYVWDYLQRAREHAQRWRDAGYGAIYVIG